jgi:hypothetical protein
VKRFVPSLDVPQTIHEPQSLYVSCELGLYPGEAQLAREKPGDVIFGGPRMGTTCLAEAVEEGLVQVGIEGDPQPAVDYLQIDVGNLEFFRTEKRVGKIGRRIGDALQICSFDRLNVEI